MASLDDLQQRVALLEGQFDALAQVAPQLERVLLMRDVNVGLVNPIADGDSLVWDSTQHGFVNGSGSGVTVQDGSYATSGTTTIPTTSSAPVAWSTLLDGDALLDLSTPTQPTVLTTGLYIFSVTAQQTATLAAEWDLSLTVRIGGGLTVRVAQTTAAPPYGFASATLAAKMTAGDDVNAAIFNHDGATAATVAIVGEVVRIS